MAIGALIRRELLRESRQGTHYVSRSLLVGGLALLVLWELLSVGPGALRSAQAVLAQYGAELFITWSVVQYFAAIAFSTVRSGALADERRKGTLPLARITALGDRGVVVGWFISVMGRVLFTMVLTLPVLVIARSLGGFTLGQVAQVVFVTVVAAAHSAALTLAIAALSGSAGTAVAISLAVQVLLMMRQFLFTGFFGLSSFGLLVAIFGGSKAVGFPTLDALLLVAACMLGLVPVYLKLAVRFLGAPLSRSGREVKGLFLAADRFFLRWAGGWGVLWKSGLGPCSGNPVLWRERAASPVGQRDHLIRLGYWVMVPVIVVSGLGLLGWGYWNPLFFFECSLLLVPLLLTAVLLLAGPATTLARERQEATLPLLAVTPLPARTIVVGKYFFALRLLLVPVAFAALFFVCYGVVFGFAPVRRYLLPFGLWRLLESPVLLPLLLLCLPVFAAALLYVGLGAKSVGSALGAGLGLLAGVPVALVAGQAFWLRVSVPGLLVSPWTAQGEALVWGSSVALLTLGVVLIPRVRWVGNAVVVGLVSGWGWLSAVELLALYLGPQTRPALSGGLVAIGALVALSVLLLWRALVHAGPGLANRTGLALLAVGLPYHVVLMLSSSRHPLGGMPYFGTGYGIDLAIALAAFPALLAVACGLTVLFLAATTKQLDRFIERHG